MENLKYVEELPYDEIRMMLVILNAGIDPLNQGALSYEKAREYCDIILQTYLDRVSGDVPADYDIVEDTIEYLTGRSDNFPRVYDKDIDGVQLHARTLKVGARVVRDSNYQIPADTDTQPIGNDHVPLLQDVQNEGTSQVNQEIIPSNASERLDNTVLDLLSKGEINGVIAENLMMLFQLRTAEDAYDKRQRNSLGVAARSFQGKLNLALKNEPTVRRNEVRVYLDQDLSDGMEILRALNELLALKETERREPLTVYVEGQMRSRKSEGDESYHRSLIHDKVDRLIRKVFELDPRVTT